MQCCECTHVFFIYLSHVVKNVCYSTISYTAHGVSFSTACLSICKNACWLIRESKKNVNMEVPWKLIMIKEERKSKKINSQLIPLTTERATSLAASWYTCLVEQSDLNTLSITKSEKRYQILSHHIKQSSTSCIHITGFFFLS